MVWNLINNNILPKSLINILQCCWKNKNKRQISKNLIYVNDSKNAVNHTAFMGQAFTDKYQTMKYCYSTREEIENIIPLNQKIVMDMISPTTLKISSPFIISPINYTCIKMLR
jgi:hypothetical protein